MILCSKYIPQSVLDMGNYLDNSDKSETVLLIQRINYLTDGSCTLSIGERGYSQHGISHRRTTHKYPLLNHLHFCKYIIIVSDGLKLTKVYSAARENAVINYDALTLSTVTESGEAAIKSLERIASTNATLANILKDIENGE